MVFDKKVQQLKYHFGITKPEDWQHVHPEWILRQEGIGPVTLDHIRIWLAARGLTLKDDRTPEHWQQHLSAAKIGHSMGEEDTAVTCPFTVLIDAQEKHPFTFKGLQTDADQGNRPLIVPTEWRSLGPGWGDYSIDGWEGHVHLERKSAEDAVGTILGWGERRERFERELEQLAGIDCAAVIVECTIGRLCQYAPARGRKTVQENAKILFRQVLAWQQDFRVPWLFCDGRRMAEVAAFRTLERFWKKRKDSEKRKPDRTLDEVSASL